jgi:hypothetical protein
MVFPPGVVGIFHVVMPTPAENLWLDCSENGSWSSLPPSPY